MQKPLAYDAVIFDLGGVLVDWDPRHFFRELFEGAEWALEDFLTTVCSPAWHNELDGGKSFADGIAELTEAHPNCAALIDSYDWGWPQMFRGEIEGSVSVLKDLAAANIPLFSITNFPAEKFDAFVKDHAFMNLFKDVLVSGRIKLTKPDPRIFDLAQKQFGIIPNRTLFIDDRADNVAAAEALGFTGHHFKSPDELRAALGL